MQIEVFGVPLDFGAGRRGVDMGPSALRYAELIPGLESLDHRVVDHGNLQVPVSETCQPGDPRLKYMEPIIAVGQALAAQVSQTLTAGGIPLVLGGDHSVALGSVLGAARARKLGLIWLDAHGDFNTQETTPSGNVHGMPLAAICGYGAEPLVTLGGMEQSSATVAPHNIAIVGVRDLDVKEKPLLRSSGVAVYSMEAVDRYGIKEVMCRALDVACRGTDGIYLSLDLDVVDPMFAPGVGTPVPGGLTFREAHLAVELIAESCRLAGMDLVEVNPILDQRNMTAELAVQLALSAFGKRIWHEP